MGLFDRFLPLKHDSNLTNVPTERLLREHARVAAAGARLSYQAQQAEFSKVIDAAEFSGSVFDLVLKANIEGELKRRGIEPPT
jgi:hypothetical protein